MNAGGIGAWNPFQSIDTFVSNKIYDVQEGIDSFLPDYHSWKWYLMGGGVGIAIVGFQKTGVGVTGLGVLTHVTERGMLPEGWPPWLILPWVLRTKFYTDKTVTEDPIVALLVDPELNQAEIKKFGHVLEVGATSQGEFHVKNPVTNKWMGDGEIPAVKFDPVLKEDVTYFPEEKRKSPGLFSYGSPDLPCVPWYNVADVAAGIGQYC